MQWIRRISMRLSLAQQFMLASLVVLVFAMLGVGWWVAQQIEQGVVDRTAGETALYVTSFVDPPLQELGRGSPLTAEHVAALDKLLNETPLGQHIVTFRVWDTQGRVLYSTNPALIGQVFPVKDELARSLRGEVVANVSDLGDEENLLERDRYHQLLEIYSPVTQNGTNQVIAAVEFYQTVDTLVAATQRAQLSSWLLFGTATLVVYLMLSIIVRRGSKTIEQQRAELSQQVEQLTEVLAQNEELHQRVSRATAHATELNERFLRRISAELHDGPAQDLGLALLRLDQVVAQSDNCRIVLASGANCRADLVEIETSVRTALEEVRAISGGLGLPDLDNLTLAETLARVIKVHQRRNNTTVATSFEQLPEQAPLPVKITLYRIIQEALNNTCRHAGGQGVQVLVTASHDRILAEIVDQGPGFDSEAPVDDTAQLGVVGMRERVESLGGRFKITSAPGAGTKVVAWLPLIGKEGNGHNGR